MTILGAFIGCLIAGGAVLVIFGATTPPAAVDKPDSRPPSRTMRRAHQARARMSRRDLIALGGAAGVGLLVALTTGWVVALVVFPLLAWAFPRLWLKPKQDDVALLSALQDWSRRLASLFAAGHHITETLAASLRSCPARIRPQVQMLVARLQAGQSTADALYSFADDISDPTCDRIADALIHASRQAEAPLGRILSDVAAMVEQEVAGRREILRAQSGPRAEGRYIVLIFLILLGGMVFFTQYGSFYHSGFGQILLLGILVGAAVCMEWIHRIITPTRPVRWLIRPEGIR